MAITLDIPESIERVLLEAAGPDLGRQAMEALLTQLYREGKISVGFLGEVLGFPTSIAALEWLNHRGVPLNYGVRELQEDLATLAPLRNKHGAGRI